MNWDMAEVEVLGKFVLTVRFQDGLAGTVKFLLSFFRGVFEHLADTQEFQKVQIIDGVVTWPGELDIASDAMHAEIKRNGEWLLN